MENMVFNKQGGTITSGGFKVNSNCMTGGASALMPVGEGKDKKSDKVSSLFNDLAVPAGLFYMKNSLDKNFIQEKSNEVVPSDLYDKLVELAENKPKKSKSKKKTLRNKKPSKQNTRRTSK
jgi:hypothetical protein